MKKREDHPIQKRVAFVFSAKKDLMAFPKEAMRTAGHNLDQVQRGLTPASAKPLHGLGRGVMELKIIEDSDAYRVVYIAKFEEAIYVLDAFQKKSPTGSKLPQHIQSRIRDRYQHVKKHRPALTKN